MLNIGFMGYMSEYGGGNELNKKSQLKIPKQKEAG